MASVAVVAGPPGTTAAGTSPAAARLPRCHHAAKLDARQQSRSWGGLVSHGNVGATPGGLRSSLRWGASFDFGSEIAPWLSSGPLRRGISSRNPAVVAAGNVERSYIMIKPDGVQRGLVGEVISRFERKGFTLRGLKLFQTPRDLAEEHYGELKERPFFPRLVEYITSGPVVAMVWEGPGAVASARKLIGVTNPLNAEPGTIRGDFGVNTGRNIIHGSDSPENGEREIALWFKDGEVLDWKPTIEPWILE